MTCVLEHVIIGLGVEVKGLTAFIIYLFFDAPCPSNKEKAPYGQGPIWAGGAIIILIKNKETICLLK